MTTGFLHVSYKTNTATHLCAFSVTYQLLFKMCINTNENCTVKPSKIMNVDIIEQNSQDTKVLQGHFTQLMQTLQNLRN